MNPLILLNWRVWALLGILAVCGGALYKAYEMGGDEPRAELAAYKAEQIEKALTASEQNRKTEQAMAEKLRKANDEYAKLQKLNADSARDLDRVRGDFQTAINSRCTANPTAPGCADGSGKLERQLLEECAGAFVGMAKTAQRLADKVIGLQGYVNAACSPPPQ